MNIAAAVAIALLILAIATFAVLYFVTDIFKPKMSDEDIESFLGTAGKASVIGAFKAYVADAGNGITVYHERFDGSRDGVGGASWGWKTPGMLAYHLGRASKASGLELDSSSAFSFKAKYATLFEELKKASEEVYKGVVGDAFDAELSRQWKEGYAWSLDENYVLRDFTEFSESVKDEDRAGCEYVATENLIRHIGETIVGRKYMWTKDAVISDLAEFSYIVEFACAVDSEGTIMGTGGGTNVGIRSEFGTTKANLLSDDIQVDGGSTVDGAEFRLMSNEESLYSTVYSDGTHVTDDTETEKGTYVNYARIIFIEGRVFMLGRDEADGKLDAEWFNIIDADGYQLDKSKNYYAGVYDYHASSSTIGIHPRVLKMSHREARLYF